MARLVDFTGSAEAKISIRIQTENQLIEDPLQSLQITEAFNVFFKEKVEKLAASIRKDPDNNPFSRLKEKIRDSNLKFNLKTVREEVVLNILRSLNQKKLWN